MKKEELIAKVVENVKEVGKEEQNAKLEGLGKKEIDAVIKVCSGIIEQGLIDGDEVPVPGVGKFAIVEKAEREALKNPRKPEDGKKVVPAHKAPKFKFGKAIKETVK